MNTESPPRPGRVREFVTTIFWLAVVAFIGWFVFHVVLGAFSPLEAAGAAVAAAICIVLLGLHAWRQHVNHESVIRDRRLRDARERRGY